MAYIYYTLTSDGTIIEGVNVNLGAVEYQQLGNRINKFSVERIVKSEKAFYREVSTTTAVKILKLIGAKY